MEKNKQQLSSSENSQSRIDYFQNEIICKVKYLVFSDYESVCFLPNNFEDLVKILSKAFFPNDFSIVYIDSKLNQKMIYSYETYNQIISDLYEDDKEVNEVKFQIMLYNVNKNKELNISKDKISKNIKNIFEDELKTILENKKAMFVASHQQNFIYRSIDDKSFSKKYKYEDSFDRKNNGNSPSSLSCNLLENYQLVESFQLKREGFNYISQDNSFSFPNQVKSSKNLSYEEKSLNTRQKFPLQLKPPSGRNELNHKNQFKKDLLCYDC